LKDCYLLGFHACSLIYFTNGLYKLAASMFKVLVDDKESLFLQNIGNSLPDCMVSHIRGWTSEPGRLYHNLCRQPCRWKVLGLQRGIQYEVSRDEETKKLRKPIHDTLCFLAMVAILKLSAMEAGLLPDKEQPYLFPTGTWIPEVCWK
jgi:hypothetical protein